MKKCTNCKETKPLEQFGIHKIRKDGRSSWCKSCKTSIDRQNRLNDRDKFKDRDLRRYYNITLEQYNEMLENQDGKCLICRTEDPGYKNEYFSVDHDHLCCPGPYSCGECVRGLLCGSCNRVVVPMAESDKVRAAIIYVDSFRNR